MSATSPEYYDKRAKEYDRIYERPERQGDIARLDRLIREYLQGRRVLEVAAGTGFWTQRFVEDVSSVLATDINESTLDVARSRTSWPDHADFRVADAFALNQIPGSFDAMFAGFLWSHIDRGDTDDFLNNAVERLDPGSVVVLVDNNYVEGNSSPISRTDPDGNTFQERVLSDGSTYEVRKNFPTMHRLRTQLEGHGSSVKVLELEYFWFATVVTGS